MFFAVPAAFAQGTATVRTLTTSSPGSVDGQGATARFSGPGPIARGSDGTLYVADDSHGSKRLRVISPEGIVTTRPGAPAGWSFSGLVADAAGNLYYTLFVSTGFTRVSPTGVATPVITSPVVGDGLSRLAMSPAGDFYLTDVTSIWRVTPAGAATLFAGGGPLDRSLRPIDGPKATGTAFASHAMTFDASGTLYLTSANIIRKVTPDGAITTIAGALGSSGSADGPGLSARFSDGLVGLSPATPQETCSSLTPAITRSASYPPTAL